MELSELPDDIRREIDKSSDRETIMEVATRLQRDGVTITRDVIAAIVMTMSITEGVVE
jgi:stage III sporulation protein SpoIIIAA